MDTEHLLSRRLDGRLDAAEARALDAHCEHDPERQRLSRSLDALHTDLQQLARSRRNAVAERALVERIAAALPTTVPARATALSIGHVLTASAAGVLVAMVFAAMSIQRDLLPLGLVTMGAVLSGLALMLLARPLRQVEAGLLERLLARRVMVTSGDVLVVRSVGFALVVGGIWLSWT
jgi:anti-sigma factor RsiW